MLYNNKIDLVLGNFLEYCVYLRPITLAHFCFFSPLLYDSTQYQCSHTTPEIFEAIHLCMYMGICIRVFVHFYVLTRVYI